MEDDKNWKLCDAFFANSCPKPSLFGRKKGMFTKLFLRPGISFTIQMARKTLSLRGFRGKNKSGVASHRGKELFEKYDPIGGVKDAICVAPMITGAIPEGGLANIHVQLGNHI